MPAEQNDREINYDTTALLSQPWPSWGRPLALAAALLFFVSSAFPLVAGFSKNTASFPKWWGALDVGLAFVLAMLAFVILALAHGKISGAAVDASYKSYRVLTHGILAGILAFFFFGDRITWIHCATGFAWRTWLLLYCLPAWFAAVEAPAGVSGPGRR